MTEIELNNEYFEWMCQLVCNERYSRRLSYQKLLRHLHNIDFQYMLPMDGNRAEDGIDLRGSDAFRHRGNYGRSRQLF